MKREDVKREDVMWCEKVLRNCGDEIPAGPDGRAIDLVDLEWYECARLLKKETRSGEPVRVMLPRGEQLRHGDVIFEDVTRVIAINVLTCQVIVASVAGKRDFGTLALELGNLHQPAQLSDDEVVFIEDGPAIEVLERMGIQWRKELRRFEPLAIRSAPAAKLAGDFRVIRRRLTGSG